MIKIENTDIYGWEAAIRGMRNPMNSWGKSDSDYRPILCKRCDNCMSYQLERWNDCNECEVEKLTVSNTGFMVGPNDLKLMKSLSKAGPDHGKFLRMINVTCDITAPLYWWKEADTYKVGTVANSCSTMHKIASKEFTLEDFSYEHLISGWIGRDSNGVVVGIPGPLENLESTIKLLNNIRDVYLRVSNTPKCQIDWSCTPSFEEPKDIWWQMIQLLPSSYNQKRTVQLNYQVLKSMYFARRNHKLDEWHNFCAWCETLPYFKEICIQEGDSNE